MSPMYVLPGKCLLILLKQFLELLFLGVASFDTSNFFRIMLRVRSFFFLEITPSPVSSRSSTSYSGKDFFLLGRLAWPASCLFKMIINQILLGKSLLFLGFGERDRWLFHSILLEICFSTLWVFYLSPHFTSFWREPCSFLKMRRHSKPGVSFPPPRVSAANSLASQ